MKTLKTSILSAVIFLLALPLKSSVEETQLADRLAAEATQFLEELLGPGKARVLVSVGGEQTETRTQSEVVIPIRNKPTSPGAVARKGLPGYVTRSEANAAKKDENKRIELFDYMQRDEEQSLRQSGLVVKSLRVSVVLDNTLSDSQVNAVRSLLPDFLHMDSERGDVLMVLRAPLLPVWKRALMNAEGVRTVFAFGSLGILAIWLSFMAYVIAIRSVRTLVSEMASRRGGGAPPPMPVMMPSANPAELLPPGGAPGELPSLTDGEPGMEGSQPMAALGHRFDYLSSKEPHEMAELLGHETPQDLALLFGYLAESNPDLATRIFSSLPNVLQGEISQSLMQMNMADPERLTMLESRLRTYMEYGVRGHERLGRILSRLPANEREEIMGDLMSRDSAGAQKVESELFPFEGVGDLPQVELRKVIGAISYQDWGVALRGCTEDLVDKILAQIPAGARASLRDAMAVSQPKEKVLETRSKILSQVYSMAAKGQVILKREGSSPELI